MSALNPPYETHPHLLGLIPPILYLIRGAVFRARYKGDNISRQDKFSLEIDPLCELVDMYHTHKATELLDKVYALLGMSNDDPEAAGLEPNYKAAWGEVFRKLVHFCLSDRMIVGTWKDQEVAVIEAKGYILGEVSSVEKDVAQYDRQNWDLNRHDRQYADIAWKNAPSYFKGSPFTFKSSAKTLKKGDVVCLLEGASRPTIIRLCGDYSTVIMVAAPLTDELQNWSGSVTTFPTDLLLVWDWGESQRKSQGGEDYGTLIRSQDVPECPVAGCRYRCLGDLGRVTRLWNLGMLLNGAERYEEAIENFRRAVEVYGSREESGSVDETYQGHRGEEEVLRIMDDLLAGDKSADMETKYKEEGQTPLFWAASDGHEAVVQLLIDKGADIEAKDRYGRTPLSWAAEKGHEAVVQLLIDKGADIEAKNHYGRTSLFWAAENGQETVMQLLINKGADIEAKDSSFDRTPLSWAAENGHEAVVQLLVDKGADIETKSSDGQTPLSWAAENGHKAVVQLLKSHATKSL